MAKQQACNDFLISIFLNSLFSSRERLIRKVFDLHLLCHVNE